MALPCKTDSHVTERGDLRVPLAAHLRLLPPLTLWESSLKKFLARAAI